ncbi:hypothetical protein [Flavobacterium sp. GNP001]
MDSAFLDCVSLQRIKIRCNNIGGSYGTIIFDIFHRAVGSIHFVATDFNPLIKRIVVQHSSVGTEYTICFMWWLA